MAKAPVHYIGLESENSHKQRMTTNHLDIKRHKGVLILTLSDPKTRNALGPDLVRALNEELDRFESNIQDRVLVLTGEDPSFCSGANVRRFDQELPNTQQNKPTESSLIWKRMESAKTCKKQIDPSSGALLPLRIHRLKKPSIAVINGYAIGVGMGLALACDIRLASERAIFSEAFVKMGLVPGDGSCWQLPRMISLSDTYLLQYTGDKIDGAEALRIGLINKLYSHNTVLREALKLAERIAAGPTLSHSLTKYLIQESMDLSLEESLDLANGAQTIARDSEDHSEAVKAFLEKRSPHFKGK